jgi:PAS domain S-box-containing protein
MNAKLRRLLPTATTLGLGLLVLVLLLNEVVSEWNIRRLVENERRVVHTQLVLTTLEEVLATVTEAETAERGFLITGDERYLKPYREAVSRTRETLQRLEALTADDPVQQGRIGPLRQRVAARFDELRRAIAAQRAGGFDAGRQSVSTNHGRELMNEMRRLVAEMKEREGQELALRAAESRRSATWTTATTRVATLLGIGLVCLAFYLIRRDLALRQRAEEATRRLAAIVESSEDAIVSETLDGIIVSWNAAAERLYGYTAREAINQPITLLYPLGQAGEVRAHLDRLRREVPIEHFETTRIHKDGHCIDVSLSLSPIKDAAGGVIGVSAIARDITERKALQREVLEIAGREQRRIGQDLHDGIGQELTGLAMLAQRLAGLLGEQSLPESAAAGKIARGLEHALGNVRPVPGAGPGGGRFRGAGGGPEGTGPADQRVERHRLHVPVQRAVVGPGQPVGHAPVPHVPGGRHQRRQARACAEHRHPPGRRRQPGDPGGPRRWGGLRGPDRAGERFRPADHALPGRIDRRPADHRAGRADRHASPLRGARAGVVRVRGERRG